MKLSQILFVVAIVVIAVSVVTSDNLSAVYLTGISSGLAIGAICVKYNERNHG